MGVLDKYQNTLKVKRTVGKNGKRHETRVQTSNLHAHLPNIDVDAPGVIKNAKDQILMDFAFGFKLYNEAQSSAFSDMSFEEVKQFLNMWNSGSGGNILANEISEAIAEKLNSDSWTGAGISKGFSQAFETGTFFTNQDILDQTNYVWNQVENRLKNYIDLFSEIEEPCLLDKCISVYKKTGRADKNFLKAYEGRKIPEGGTSVTKKVNSVFKKMQSNLDEIFSLEEQAKKGKPGDIFGGTFSKAKNTELTPQELAKRIGGGFNTLGGEEVGELVGTWAAKQVKELEDPEILAEIEKIFKASGGKIIVSARQTGQSTVKVGGHVIQKKGDWEIILDNGCVKVVIPVSQKLYQSSNKKDTLFLPANELFTGKSNPQSLSLHQLLAMSLEGSPAWFEQHMAVLSSTLSNRIDIKGNHGSISKAVMQWNEFREAAKYIGLFRALVGTGAVEKSNMDFAALYVVNSQIFSMQDILQKIVNKPELLLTSWKNGTWIPTFPEIRERVSGPYYNGFAYIDEIGNDPTERIRSQYGAIRELYGQKYRFEINIGVLSSLI